MTFDEHQQNNEDAGPPPARTPRRSFLLAAGSLIAGLGLSAAANANPGPFGSGFLVPGPPARVHSYLPTGTMTTTSTSMTSGSYTTTTKVLWITKRLTITYSGSITFSGSVTYSYDDDKPADEEPAEKPSTFVSFGL